jgi:two-component system, cell cycle response regulator DivK
MSESSPEPIRILVVDDFHDNREMYAAYLRFSGFIVVEAVTGMEAIEMALATTPNLIVMDLSLPGMDGWEATRRLKGDPNTKHIPIIVVSGHALEGSVQAAKMAGCDAFLRKPCLPQALLAEVRKLLS